MVGAVKPGDIKTMALKDSIRKKTALIFLMTNLLNTQGERCYVYFAVRMDWVPSFVMAARNHGEVYDLESFGKVLASGQGDTPTDAQRQQMEAEYGFNHREAVILPAT